METRLEGAVALVVGGASGIGWATAQLFAAQGARVVIGDLNGAAARERAGQLPQARGLEVDVTDEQSVAAMAASIMATEGSLDAVVNCAGLGHAAYVVDHELADWQRILDVCLTGAFLVTKHTGRIVADSGSIVTISSLNSRQPAQGYAAYCSAKAGVNALTEVAALELAPRGVRVNAISPGLIDTPLTDELKAIPGVQDEFTANTPLGRNGRPDEIAAAAVFLSSPLAEWTTGAVLDVNGGGHLRRYPDVMARLADLPQG